MTTKQIIIMQLIIINHFSSRDTENSQQQRDRMKLCWTRGECGVFKIHFLDSTF